MRSARIVGGPGRRLIDTAEVLPPRTALLNASLQMVSDRAGSVSEQVFSMGPPGSSESRAVRVVLRETDLNTTVRDSRRNLNSIPKGELC